MKDFLEKIVSCIVSRDSPFQIKEEEQSDLFTYTVLVPESEVGKVIGKQGKVISSIRTLARLKAFNDQKRVLIKVEAASL